MIGSTTKYICHGRIIEPKNKLAATVRLAYDFGFPLQKILILDLEKPHRCLIALTVVGNY